MEMARPAWWFDEFQHLGVDFDDVEQVETYSRKQGTRSEDEKRLIARLGISSADRVIEFGCGTGIFAIEAAQHCRHVYAVDISKTMLEYVQRVANQREIANLSLIHGGFLSYEHEADPVQFIVTKYAFHHLPDFWKAIALQRISKMLQPGGVFYLEDVIFSFPPSDHKMAINSWIGRVANPDRQSFSASDFEMHVREEHSTFTWIIEGLLEQNGFEIREQRATNSEYANYIAVKR